MGFVKQISLTCVCAIVSHAAAVTPHLLVRFEGSLNRGTYTLGVGEIDSTNTFAANGSPVMSEGQARLKGSAIDDSNADGFKFDPSDIGPLTTKNWVAEAVIAFDSYEGGLSTVIDVQGDTDFRLGVYGNYLEAGYSDGGEARLTSVPVPERNRFIHLALVWDAEVSSLTAYTNGVPIGTIDQGIYETPDAHCISYGYFGRSGFVGRGIDGWLYAVSFATSDRAISAADFLVNTLPPGQPEVLITRAVDPRFPEEWHAQENTAVVEWSRWPPARIRDLEEERSELLEQISNLPQHRPIFQSNRLGYHSPFKLSDNGQELPDQQIDLKWPWGPILDSIALTPAFNLKKSSTYAFPKRFKIEVFNQTNEQFETVVDWTEEDFPDPGLYPVYFGDIHKRVTQIRLTVPQIPNASGAAYYAIGEIHPFQQRPDGTTGANMAEWGSGHVEIEESEPFSQPPFWDISYLHDGVVGLGFPLSDELVKSEDLWVTYEHQDDLNVEVELLLDLGQLRPIGRVDFWPAKAPHSLILPSFGFPSDIQVELSETSDFSVVKVLRVKNGEEVGHFDNVLSVVGQAYDARYIRVTIRGLPEHQGKPILGLGEIFVTEFDEPYSLGCKVTARGIPEKDLDQLPRLVDGCSWQRRILPEGEWIRGLAQRRPLDRRLALVEEELELARSNWQGTKRQWLLTGSVFLLFAFFVVLIVQRRIRIQGINKFKMRVARDLHDDVGSNLGSISLTVEHLKDLEVGDAVKAELGDLSLLAREACASLREVVWVIDERTIRLPDLIGKLAERAERVLHGIDLSVERPEFCPEVEVSLPFKRNLIMFFKEAIHNCARHSQASHVWILFLTKDKKLQIIVRDDGCGFDPQLQFTGWGLESMKDRAREIGGRVDIRSQSGQGTEVILKVPFSCLLTPKDDFYKTSN